MHRYTRLGLWIFLAAGASSFLARTITWPAIAYRSGQIEATRFYSMQKSLETICEYVMLLSVGMILIGLWERRNEAPLNFFNALPEGLKEEEKEEFEKWLAADLSRKYLNQDEQVKQYRRDLSK